MISSLIEHASAFHADTEIVSLLPQGHIRRTTWSHSNKSLMANDVLFQSVREGDRGQVVSAIPLLMLIGGRSGDAGRGSWLRSPDQVYPWS